MKLVLTILIIMFSLASFAQPADLRAAAERFDKSMVEKDSAALRSLVHPFLSYGHSNAWVQSNDELIIDLFNGKITYTKIESRDFTWTSISPTYATICSTADMEYVLDGKPGKLKLHVLQVWKKGRSGWQLLARQSTKIEDKH